MLNHGATAVRAGFLTFVQDLGRTGFREFGVSLSGALDSFGLRVANLLVGNDEDTAGVEITLAAAAPVFKMSDSLPWCGGEFDVHVGSIAFPLATLVLVTGWRRSEIRSTKSWMPMLALQFPAESTPRMNGKSVSRFADYQSWGAVHRRMPLARSAVRRTYRRRMFRISKRNIHHRRVRPSDPPKPARKPSNGFPAGSTVGFRGNCKPASASNFWSTEFSLFARP